MKTLVLAFALLAAGSVPAFAQTTLAGWTFETNTPADVTDSATISNIAADVGTFAASSFSSGVHASSLTDWSTPAGNGSANSLSSTNWAVGDYFQFRTATIGYSGVKISFDQTSSNSGPRDFKLAYSTNGSSFTDFGSTYSVLANNTPNPTWSAGTPHAEFHFNFDLSTITLLDNASNVYFRLIDAGSVSANGGTVAATGTDRVDNFTITAIPEPSTYALFGGLAAFGLALRRRFSRTAVTSAA